MTIIEFEDYLKSIDGLKYAHGYIDRDNKLLKRGFFEVNDGWLLLIKNLIDDLVKTGWDKNVCQVKEKFGGLRFYIESYTDEQDTIIENHKNLNLYRVDIIIQEIVYFNY